MFRINLALTRPVHAGLMSKVVITSELIPLELCPVTPTLPDHITKNIDIVAHDYHGMLICGSKLPARSLGS